MTVDHSLETHTPALPSSSMYSSYDSPWQRSTNPPHNTAYRPPPLPSLTSTHQEPPRYPPKPNEQLHVRSYDPSFLASKPSHEVADGAALRGGTPSPTPSEQKELTSGAIDWKAMTKWRFWIRREWLCTSDLKKHACRGRC